VTVIALKPAEQPVAASPIAATHATRHRLHLGDARELGWLEDGSVHLVVTSPPYWTLKKVLILRVRCGDSPVLPALSHTAFQRVAPQ
jgi:DNA modification methylase